MSSPTLKKDSFQILLDGFHETIKGYPEIAKVEVELNDLIQAATLNNELNDRQKDAIIARCKYYLAGEYGEQVKRVDNRSEYSKKLS